jgi:septum formation protein
LNNLSIVLASGSRYRRELLERLGVSFETWSPDIDEQALPCEPPRETAVRLARAKAEAAGKRFGSAWIIGSDQVADLDGQPLGKPGTVENARRQLRQLAFRRLTDLEIDRYLAREPALDCAGSAKSEGLGISLLSRLGGDDPTALVGLPLIALSAMLRAEGFDAP